MYLCQGGAEYASELVLGSDPISWVSVFGLSHPVHLFFPPFAAFSRHSLQLLPLLRRHCAGATVLSVNGSSKGIGIGCCSSNKSRSGFSSSAVQHEGHSGQNVKSKLDRTPTPVSPAQQEGASSLVLLNTSHTVHALDEQAAAANELSSAVSCIHTEDLLKELTSMKASALRWASRLPLFLLENSSMQILKPSADCKDLLKLTSPHAYGCTHRHLTIKQKYFF